MKETKKDWQISTTRERIKFIFVIMLSLIFGGIGMTCAILFTINYIDDQVVYPYLNIAIFSLFVVILLSKVNLTPQIRREANNTNEKI